MRRNEIDARTRKICAPIAVFILTSGVIAVLYGLTLIYPPLAWVVGGSLLAVFGFIGIERYG